jgi:hypothetical protein
MVPFFNVIIFMHNNKTFKLLYVLSVPSSVMSHPLMHLCYVCLQMPPSCGGSLAYYHVAAISSPRFLLGNRRLGLEPDSQKESIGGIFESQALNLSFERFFKVDFL